jgi:hypothetical protein
MSGKIKFLWPVVGLIVMALLTTFQDALTDQNISAQEWVQVTIQAVMAVNVWATANLPQFEKMKTLVAAVLVTLQALYTFVIGGVDTPELINLAITFLSALGVAFARQPVTKVIQGETVPPGDQPRAERQY